VTHEDAIIGIAMGAAGIFLGLRGAEFYSLGPGRRPKPGTRTIPRWFGQFWCIGIGAWLIYWSLPGLRGSWHWRDLGDDWWLLPFFGVVCMLNLMLSEPESETEIQSLHLGPNANDN
jgi:hypothetical protein